MEENKPINKEEELKPTNIEQVLGPPLIDEQIESYMRFGHL